MFHTLTAQQPQLISLYRTDRKRLTDGILWPSIWTHTVFLSARNVAMCTVFRGLPGIHSLKVSKSYEPQFFS